MTCYWGLSWLSDNKCIVINYSWKCKTQNGKFVLFWGESGPLILILCLHNFCVFVCFYFCAFLCTFLCAFLCAFLFFKFMRIAEPIHAYEEKVDEAWHCMNCLFRPIRIWNAKTCYVMITELTFVILNDSICLVGMQKTDARWRCTAVWPVDATEYTVSKHWFRPFSSPSVPFATPHLSALSAFSPQALPSGNPSGR